MRCRKFLTVGFLCVIISIASSDRRPAWAVPALGEPIAQELADLVQGAPLIIVGEVVEIRPGRVAGQGEARMQFNDILIRVEKTLKGSASESIIVERVAPQAGEVIVGLGPPYRLGVRYLLFLRPGEAPRYVPVRQGYYVLRDGLVHPAHEGPVAEQLKGKEAAEVLMDIETIVARES